MRQNEAAGGVHTDDEDDDDDDDAHDGVDDDGDDSEGRREVCRQRRPFLSISVVLHHELVELREVHPAVLVLVDVVDDLVHLLVGHLHLLLDLVQQHLHLVVLDEAFLLVVQDSEHLLVASLLVFVRQQMLHLAVELVEKVLLIFIPQIYICIRHDAALRSRWAHTTAVGHTLQIFVFPSRSPSAEGVVFNSDPRPPAVQKGGGGGGGGGKHRQVMCWGTVISQAGNVGAR